MGYELLKLLDCFIFWCWFANKSSFIALFQDFKHFLYTFGHQLVRVCRRGSLATGRACAPCRLLTCRLVDGSLDVQFFYFDRHKTLIWGAKKLIVKWL
jgi:hypothetical protein